MVGLAWRTNGSSTGTGDIPDVPSKVDGRLYATQFEVPLGSGHIYDLLSPETSTLTIEDIAYGLAFRSKFGGQTVSRITKRRAYYSLAEHCVRGSHVVDPNYARDFLFHELDKVIWGEFDTAQIHVAGLLAKLLRRTRTAHAAKLNLHKDISEEVKRADRIMEATERRDLLVQAMVRGEPVLWPDLEDVKPLADPIEPWGPEEAAERFLMRSMETEGE